MLIHHPNITSRNSLAMCVDLANPKSYSGTGTTIIDLTTNKYNMGIVGAVYSNLFSGIISMNGTTTQYLTFSNAATIIAGVNNPKTMEYWLRVTNLSSRYSCLWTTAGLWISVETTGAIRLGITASIQILLTASGLVSAGNWYNLVVTRNASNAFSIYLNGILVGGPLTYPSTISAAGGARVGGGLTGGGTFNGDFGLIRTYNISLTSSQVLQNYNATKGRFGL